jgi:chaperonin GroES
VRYDTDLQGDPLNDKEPVEYFTHYGFLPNSDGFYALGIGHLVGRINSAVNKLLRQTIDAGTLANMKSGFIAEGLGVRKGELEMSMGKFVKVTNLGGRIADHIQEFQFSGPDQTIAAMIELLLRRGDRLATVTEALTGQMEKVQQPTAILALIEQGLEVFSAVYERLWESWSCELRKLYRLNSRYLSEKEYITVLDIDGLERFEIRRKDYAEDLEVIPIADPRMTTDQARLTRATAEWQFLSANPLVMSSPTHFYNASRRYLEALETTGIEEILPRPPEPGRIDDPQLENAGALMPTPVIPPVFPDQDHLAHMQAHEAFLRDPGYGPRIPPNGRAMLEMHIQKHLALLYGVTESMGGFDGAGSGGYHPMAPESGDGMVPGAVGGEVPTSQTMAGGTANGGSMPTPGTVPGA